MNRNEKRVMDALNFCRDAGIAKDRLGYALYTKRRLNYIRKNDTWGFANHMGTGTSLSDLYKTSYVSHRTLKWLLDSGLIRKTTCDTEWHSTSYRSTEIIKRYPHLFEKFEVY